MADLADKNTKLSQVLLPPKAASPMTILELGTGCGIVGIALAQTIPNANVLLTDLPEAKEIVQRNIDQASKAPGASLQFLELDWDAALPSELQTCAPISLVVAADCTYNSDSRYGS
jgi:methylase of polypeptide subunit release factors